MGDYVQEFDGLIAMIQTAVNEKDFKGIAVRNYADKFVYGEMMGGHISEPFELHITDKDNICQHLYDCLINEFGEQLVPGYSHSFDGSYRYFMTLGDNVMIFFPEGYEYSHWVYNQVQKDNEKYRQEEGKSK